ncbi:MAG TPA: PEP-CTERM sorting domain-containing protein [Rhizomicrobium sp.]|jgi:hypothetical protein|nr:PEP-CTERM sorting domain-containing protein [Rhizomicrobium sp.]
MLERKIKLALLGAAAGASMIALSAGSASAVTIDGISFDTGSQFTTATVYENNVTTVGQHLQGVGIVTQITAPTCSADGATICWQSGDAGHELTFTFDYVLEAIGLTADPSVAQAVFGNGIINFYSDGTPDANPTTGTGYGDGNLWLSLIGGTVGKVCSDYTAIAASCLSPTAPITLAATYPSDGLLAVDGAGAGHGYLDVDLGPNSEAGANYDTNGEALGHDLTLDTSFDIRNPTPVFGIKGTASLNTTTIPEPTTLSLFGMGLAGLGFGALRRRRNKA